jgi:hypothetical protein
MESIELEDTKFKRCEEAILFGSLYEALFSKFVNIEDVLEYLLKTEKDEDKDEDENIRKMIAYRIVSIFSKEQKVKGSHFINLTENKDYVGIYILSYPTILTISGGNEDENLKIVEKAQRFFPGLIKNGNVSRFFQIIFEIGSKRVIQTFEDALIASVSRCITSLPNFLNYYKTFLLADYLEPLEHVPSDKYAFDLIERAIFLKEKAPLYWNYVGYPLYSKFVEKKFKNPKFDKKLIEIYDKIFPNLFSDDVKNRSQIVIKLLQYDRYVQAYLLGFPIHEYTPNEQNIKKALNKLQEIGIEKYCQEVIKNNLEFYFGKVAKIMNQQNVNFDDIKEFNSFDVIFYYIDSNDSETKKVFLFSRPEFKNLIKDKKNFYTNEKLPEEIRLQIKSRIKIADKYKLPESETLYDLLTNLETNKLIFKKKKLQNEIEDEIENEIEDEMEDEIQNINRRESFRVSDRNTGEEYVVNIPPIPEEYLENFENLNSEEEEELLEHFFSQEGYDYLGRVNCVCPECDREIFNPGGDFLEDLYDEDEDEDEEEEYEDEIERVL